MVHVRDVHSLQLGLGDLKGPVVEGRCPDGLNLIGPHSTAAGLRFSRTLVQTQSWSRGAQMTLFNLLSK